MAQSVMSFASRAGKNRVDALSLHSATRFLSLDFLLQETGQGHGYLAPLFIAAGTNNALGSQALPTAVFISAVSLHMEL